MTEEPTVAIACQGGGSHTAFTAGVLKRLLPAVEDQLVGLSGTSGGAISATAGWYGLLAADEDPADRIDAVWTDIAADGVLDRLTNDWLVSLRRVETAGLAVPAVSPYWSPPAAWGCRQLRRTLERHITFERLSDLAGGDAPHLVIGTVNVNAGEFETFEDGAVTPDALLASAAVPDLFRAVEIRGHYHWDGLFSQNPPIQDLMAVDVDRRPTELWVVQINPQTREGEPTSLPEIADRRNELAGNLSLNQELRFIERVNEWIRAGHLPASTYRQTEIRRLQLDRPLGRPSKVDRNPSFIHDLIARGEERADEFLMEVRP